MNTVGISSNDKYLLLLLLQLMFKVPSVSTHTGSQTSRLRHWFTATQMMLWSKSHHSSISRSVNWLTSRKC